MSAGSTDSSRASPPPGGAAVFTGCPVVVGHRGARREAPENTLAAFATAARQGATWVELDVRLSADGHPVVVHDAVLPDGRPVVDVDAGDLDATGVRRLDHVLDRLPPGLGVDVEVKHRREEPGWDPRAGVASATLGVLGPRVGSRPLLVTSFDPLVLEVAGAARTVPTGLLTGVLTPLSGCADRAKELGCAVAAVHFTAPGLSDDGVAAGHDEGLQILVWTVNSSWRTRRLAACGVDAICTDDVAGTVALLGGAPTAP